MTEKRVRLARDTRAAYTSLRTRLSRLKKAFPHSMDDPQGAQPMSSPLSSLSPSPPPPREQGDEPARKRPRLAGTRSPSPADFVPARLSAANGVQTSRSEVGDVCREADQVDMTASLARLAPEEQDSDATPGSFGYAGAADAQQVGATTVRPGERDDSGVGWLPSENDKPDLQEEEIAKAGVEDARDEEEEIEFDGDDIWLGFDDADVGFDQPTTFPSSALVPASVVPHMPSTVEEQSMPLTSGPAESLGASEPRLKEFGFANFDPAGGFVFATRKPFAISEQSMQRARALLDAADEPDDWPEEAVASSRPDANEYAETSTRLALPTPARPTSAQDLVRTSTPAIDLAPAPASSPVRPTNALGVSLGDFSSLGGFQNAAGRNLKLPSEGAMKRARDKLEAKSPSPTKGSSAILRPARPRAGSRGSPSKDVFAIRAAATGAPTPRVFDLKPIAMTDRAPPVTLSPIRSKGTSGDTSASPPRRPPHLAAGSPLRRQLPLDALELQKRQQASLENIEAGPADVGYSASPDTGPWPTALPQQSTATAPGRQPARLPQSEERREAAQPASASRVSGFRPPLRPAAGNAALHTSTPARITRAPSSTPFKIPGAASANPLHPQNRRLSFGLTPQAKPFHLSNARLSTPSSTGRTVPKAFVTPFKGGKRPEGLTPMGLKSIGAATALRAAKTVARDPLSASGRKRDLPSRVADFARREKAKVFDLEGEHPSRDPFAA